MGGAHFALDGRQVLVTGASRGIGRALAEGCHAAGASVTLAGRHADALAAVAATFPAGGPGIASVTVDVASVASIESMFAELAKRGTLPDILINNAGTEEVRPSTDVDEALWDRIVDTNLKGAFFTARAFASALLSNDRRGCVLNLCSLTSLVGVPTAVPYTSSKSGLLGMTRALSAEWAPKGIRVNALGPGYFRTELTEVFYQNEDWAEAMLAKIPQGRFGRLDDLVGAAVFLCSDAAAYITGQMLMVDGGYSAAL